MNSSLPAFLILPYTLLKDAFQQESWFMGIMAAALGLVYIVLVVVVLGGVFYLADTLYQPTWKDTATVTKLDHNPAWVEWITVYDGKTTNRTPIYHPESWNAEITARNQSMSCPISSKQYHAFNLNDTVEVTLRQGRISRSYYCDAVL